MLRMIAVVFVGVVLVFIMFRLVDALLANRVALSDRRVFIRCLGGMFWNLLFLGLLVVVA